jgi:hypothetical protein
MKVFWTDKATSHLLSIYEYIQQDSPIYAEKLLDKLISRSEQIASFLRFLIKEEKFLNMMLNTSERFLKVSIELFIALMKTMLIFLLSYMVSNNCHQTCEMKVLYALPSI